MRKLSKCVGVPQVTQEIRNLFPGLILKEYMGCSGFAYQFDLFEIASLCSNKYVTT